MNKLQNNENTANYIVLDVDRTIINGTSWYRACSYPNLLINEDNINTFLSANEKFYNNGNENDRSLFRSITFNLIEKNISNKFINIIEKESKFQNVFTIGEPISVKQLYSVGYYTAKHLVDINPHFIKSMELLLKLTGMGTQILFLSSGYEPFMQGVIEYIIENLSFTNNYQIICTPIELQKHALQESNLLINQHVKTKIIKKLIENGNKILFLADDSNEDMNLYKTVKENNGFAFKVEYDKNNISNWSDLYNILSSNNLKEYLISKCPYMSIKEVNISNPFIDWLSNRINEIGIVNCSIEEYNKILSVLTYDKDSLKKFKLIMQDFTYKKNEKVYFRGLMYYYWLPPYIVKSLDSMYIRWKKLIDTSKNALIQLLRLSENNSRITKTLEWEIITYVILEHIFEGILFGLNFIEKGAINSQTNNSSQFNLLNNIIQNISDLIVVILSGKTFNSKKMFHCINTLNKLNIKEFTSINHLHQFMRELDNNYIIFCSALSIGKTIVNKRINFDYIINLPYGGMAIGYIFKSILKELYHVNNLPKIINCHYSSKTHSAKSTKYKEFWECIPNHYNHEKEMIKNGGYTILIYDNNVTTFETLNNCKTSIEAAKNQAYCATVSVNYDNICKCFSLLGQGEPLNESFYNTLDFPPVEEYITSYNTWNTSKKAKILEEIFFQNIQKEMSVKFNNKLNKNDFEFKLCRVHNLYDLQIAANAGVTMIGIHAVYNNKENYANNESKFKPIRLNTFSSYPVSDYEIDSIRNMVQQLPCFIKPVVVFEKPITKNDILKCFGLYGINPKQAGIQLQYSIKGDDLIEFEDCFSFIIVTLGIQQQDFKKDFDDLYKKLNPNRDYILLDLSKHQPGLADNNNIIKSCELKYFLLNIIGKQIENSNIPLLVADDTEPNIILNYIDILKKYNLNIIGIDTQNSVELNQNEQRYQIIQSIDSKYQVRIKKSIQKLNKWKNTFNLNKNEVEFCQTLMN
ncbi:MAG: hypothetical protein NC213_03500 [Acetobacter sp.]|nr:hypothetical protein [Bacteroides sp.]MCM1340789.1 hypothetical protein [Acetobacter sp.]MCM1432654.1 hypothetical protein [Clostridiales bacterium]